MNNSLHVVEPNKLAVSLEVAAQMIGTCKRTVERLRDRGELRCLRIGRHWKVRVVELQNYLRRSEIDL